MKSRGMTNLEYIKQMDVDDFTDWFVKQCWPELDPYMNTINYASRWHAIRNFLLSEHTENSDDSSN